MVPSQAEPGISADRPKQPTRREAILNLVEMLLQQGGDESETNRQPNLQDDKDVPSVHEHLQVLGGETFNKFKTKVHALDKELSAFSNSIRQLGSSAGVLSATYNLREGMARVLHLYRENAADLFPRKVARNTPEDIQRRRMMTTRNKIFAGAVTHSRGDEKVDPERFPLDFPTQFSNLAKNVTAFRFCLNEFPELTDDAVLLTINSSILSFEADLLYWVSCLEQYRGQFHYPSVKRYLHDLSSDLGVQLDNLTSTISMFIEVAVPAIHFAQRHGSKNLQNLSTVATFFSAVTATTIQFSYQLDHSAISVTVNCFWFASLVFSIAAAVNSLLGLTWKQAMYRSPNHRVPRWVLRWIKRSPLLFLVLSVACFSVGLCCFAYASASHHFNDHHHVDINNLFWVSAWFAFERWTFGRHRGSKWFSDVLMEKARAVRMRVKALGFKTLTLFSIKGSPGRRDPEGCSTDTSRPPTGLIPMRSQPVSAAVPPPSVIPGSHNQQLWTNAIRTIIMRSEVSSNLAALAVSHTRVTALKPKLRCLQPVQDIIAHQGKVRHLHFSSDGKFLVTSSWDRSSVVFRVGPAGCEPRRILAHTRGFVGQVAWSPSGNILLTKLARGITIWAEDGVCKQAIDRPDTIESIVWLPDGKAFLSVEGSDVMKLNLFGKVLLQYRFDKMKLQDVAVTPDGHRLLAVGSLSESPNGLRPSKGRKENILFVLNIETGFIENRTPVLNNVSHVSLSQSFEKGIVALVSYENEAPPQLWKMDLVKDRDNNLRTTARLTLIHTYIPLKGPVDLAGPSYFGGKKDELIFSAGKAGDIYIWDQESGALLHHFHAPVVGADLTCIAWNRATEDPFMFATGSHDGTVRIWSKYNDTLEHPGTVAPERPLMYQDDVNIKPTPSPYSTIHRSTTTENALTLRG
ncbi:hypothetical protein C8J56DRAFT_168138 [Mycena floridula]|nr:hypothetical protein C8J56DRAFT_168138 [Mycena floridula]